MHLRLVLFALLSGMLLTGCIRSSYLIDQTAPVTDPWTSAERVSASDCMFNLLGVIPFSGPPLLAAKQKLLLQTQAHALADAEVTHEYMFALVGYVECVELVARPVHGRVPTTSAGESPPETAQQSPASRVTIRLGSEAMYGTARHALTTWIHKRIRLIGPDGRGTVAVLVAVNERDFEVDLQTEGRKVIRTVRPEKVERVELAE